MNARRRRTLFGPIGVRRVVHELRAPVVLMLHVLELYVDRVVCARQTEYEYMYSTVQYFRIWGHKNESSARRTLFLGAGGALEQSGECRREEQSGHAAGRVAPNEQ